MQLACYNSFAKNVHKIKTIIIIQIIYATKFKLVFDLKTFLQKNFHTITQFPFTNKVPLINVMGKYIINK